MIILRLVFPSEYIGLEWLGGTRCRFVCFFVGDGVLNLKNR